MTALFVIGFILIVAFSLALGAYLTFYKLNIINKIARAITFLVLSLVIALVTFTLVVIAIWPAY